VRSRGWLPSPRMTAAPRVRCGLAGSVPSGRWSS